MEDELWTAIVLDRMAGRACNIDPTAVAAEASSGGRIGRWKAGGRDHVEVWRRLRLWCAFFWPPFRKGLARLDDGMKRVSEGHPCCVRRGNTLRKHI